MAVPGGTPAPPERRARGPHPVQVPASPSPRAPVQPPSAAGLSQLALRFSRMLAVAARSVLPRIWRESRRIDVWAAPPIGHKLRDSLVICQRLTPRKRHAEYVTTSVSDW